MTTKAICFSRNRALQLDATLRSFLLHCQDAKDISLAVLFKADGEPHIRQYRQLQQEDSDYANISFVQQQNFRKDLFRLLLPYHLDPAALRRFWWAAAAGPRLPSLARRWAPASLPGEILFLVDDNLFVRDFFTASAVQSLHAVPDALGFSLRLGKNTTYCYHKDRPQTLPVFSSLPGEIFKFHWPGADADFGYPLEVSSSIYRLADILPYLARLPFHNPNLLEGRMSAHWRDFAGRFPSLLCFEQSVTFCNPVNKVQNVYDNRSGSQADYSSDNLARRFEQGERIDVQAFNGLIPEACHQEVQFTWKKV